MSYLSSNNSEFLSARITKKGRQAIAKGNFVIEYFQIGDSEFDYTPPFTAYTGLGSVPHQKVLSPFDIEAGVKYPYKLDSSDDATTFGNPVQNASTVTIRNIMGPAGHVSNYLEYDENSCTGTTVECLTERIDLNTVSGTNTISVSTGNTYDDCEFITLVFSQFVGMDPDHPVISGNSSSLIYKISGITTGVSTNTIYLDRDTPDFSSLSGYAQVVCNKCNNEYPIDTQISPVCHPNDIDTQQQLDPWTMEVVWTEKPIGFDVNGLDENLSGFTSNVYVSTKELYGYTESSGQTFTNYTGGTLSNPTAYYNSFNEEIIVEPESQRCVAIIHYSELGDIINDPERFFKYDDYISNDTDSAGNSIIDDPNGVPLSDTEYFEVYIPWIYYHRNTGTTFGAIFYMDSVDYYIRSTKNAYHSLKYRYLIDEQGYRVGKVFVNNKVIVFDDQELVAVLDYKSNRRYTLPAPKVSVVPSDTNPSNSILTGGTGQTIWITYMFEYTGDTQLNGLPCNYYNSSNLDPSLNSCAFNVCSNVTMKISGSTMPNMKNTFSGSTDGFIANKFYILAQETNVGETPSHDQWILMDYTTEAGGDGSNLINPTGVTDVTYTITKSKFNSGTIFDLEDYLGPIPNEPSTSPQFGDEQPFPGSIRLIRATDVEQMNFLVNLPSSQFTQSQNPTFSSGAEKRITEIALLNSNKEPYVVAKTPTPIERTGTQVFAIRLDF